MSDPRDYKDTLFLPKTDFPMRAGLPKKEPEHLQRYRFGLRTADFLLCRRCGVYIGAVIETPKGRFGIINTHSLVDPLPAMAAREPVSYDGEDTGGRVARREERWSRVTGFPE